MIHSHCAGEVYDDGQAVPRLMGNVGQGNCSHSPVDGGVSIP